LPIRKIPLLAEAATLQSLKHCNSNLTWKCISTRLQNAPGSPTHHHELHRELSALQAALFSLSVHEENEHKSGRRGYFIASQFHILCNSGLDTPKQLISRLVSQLCFTLKSTSFSHEQTGVETRLHHPSWPTCTSDSR